MNRPRGCAPYGRFSADRQLHRIITSMIGLTLGHYRIASKLGEGGMGVVYKARDMHLDRFVAIKVLPSEAVSNPERMRRFVQEAKTASALNHPNIIHIYDINTAVSSERALDFIAMELVTGRPVNELVRRKGLPVAEALRYAVQIADGLAAAHAAGIVHRDIKPANIMVTEQGHVKLLDFGLAKLTEAGESNSFATTLTDRVDEAPRTEEGTIIGTAGYMSPEQAQGKLVDARSDIFSFGSVLYEMVTGSRAFQGTTRLATLSAILEKEPKPFAEVAPGLPRELERIINHCLRKNPARRFQHMADIKMLLEGLKEESESGKLAADVPANRNGSRRHWWKVAGALGVAAVLFAAGFARFGSGRGTTAENSEVPVIRVTSDSGLTTEPALSPDGKLVAYASDRAVGDNLDIWVQQIDGGAPLRLTSDAADEFEPTFSPDGSKIAFRSDRDGGGVYVIPALGGEPRLVAKGGRHPAFSPDGSHIAFVTGLGGLGGVNVASLFVVPSTGGTPQKLVPLEIGAASPVWSPNGKFILFGVGEYRIENWGIVPSDLSEPVAAAGEQQLSTAMSSGHWGSLILLPLEAFKKAGLADLTPRQWLPGNRILFSAKSGDTSHIFEIGLMAPSLLNRRWHLDSSPKRLTFGTGLEEWPSVSSSPSTNGSRRLTFASVARSENVWSVALDGDHPQAGGKLQQLTSDSGFDIFPSASADGKKVSFIAHTAYNDAVWFLDLTTGKKTQLSTNVSVKFKSLIRRDGSQVYYGDTSAGGIFAVSTSGGAPEQLCHDCNTWQWDWSPDRKRILTWDRYGGFASLDDATSRSVRAAIVNLETGKRSVFLQRRGEDLYEFQWSPDGKWIAFHGSQVYVIPFTGDRGPDESAWIPLPDSAKSAGARWSPDGNWIYVESRRDGFPCIWAYPLDPQTKRPAGKAIPVYHSHGARISIRNALATSGGLAVARDKIVFGQGQIAGNIWMTELQEH